MSRTEEYGKAKEDPNHFARSGYNARASWKRHLNAHIRRARDPIRTSVPGTSAQLAAQIRARSTTHLIAKSILGARVENPTWEKSKEKSTHFTKSAVKNARYTCDTHAFPFSLPFLRSFLLLLLTPPDHGDATNRAASFSGRISIHPSPSLSARKLRRRLFSKHVLLAGPPAAGDPPKSRRLDARGVRTDANRFRPLLSLPLPLRSERGVPPPPAWPERQRLMAGEWPAWP